MKILRRVAYGAAFIAALTLLTHAQEEAHDPLLSYQKALEHFNHAEYLEALGAFDAATRTDDADLVKRARQGKVRAALRIAEFDSARRDAELLMASGPVDAETRALHGDSLWATGMFDEAESAYRDALSAGPDLSRARLGLGRALASRTQLDDGLRELLAGLAMSPRDPELHAVAGSIYERLNRFDEAARAYATYADLLPAGEATAIVTARSRAEFLRGFEDRVPLAMSDRDGREQHTLPFKLIKNKVVVQGRINGVRTDWVLDTGAERTGISRELAMRVGVRPMTTTLTAGVGGPTWRRVALGRIDSLEVGSLRVRNVPVSIRTPAFGGTPRWQSESLSPLALGFSVMVDYPQRRVTLARTLPDDLGTFRLPMRVHRLPLVRGMLNSKYPASFVVDTGGELISISAETANALGMRPSRHIRLRVFGLMGLDETAFLLPGVDLDFEDIEYRKVGLAVLNLRAPSVLLGFQVGGIVGHKLLGGYRVSIDMARSELRLSN
jgi:predicted aspartyl protease